MQTSQLITGLVQVRDVPALLSLFAEWGHEMHTAGLISVLKEWQKTPRAKVLAAELDGAIAGLVGVCAHPLISAVRTRSPSTGNDRQLCLPAPRRRRRFDAGGRNQARAWSATKSN